jgi:DnaJ-class molecular chaperone
VNHHAGTEWMQRELQMLAALNIANGLCPDCGGAGEVFDIAKITSTGNPFHGKRCPHCRGTGKPSEKDLAR